MRQNARRAIWCRNVSRRGMRGSSGLARGGWEVTLLCMSNVAQIEDTLSRLSLKEAEEVREWLEQWIEDQCEMKPEFLASIERGKADLAAGRTRVVRPS